MAANQVVLVQLLKWRRQRTAGKLDQSSEPVRHGVRLWFGARVDASCKPVLDELQVTQYDLNI